MYGYQKCTYHKIRLKPQLLHLIYLIFYKAQLFIELWNMNINLKKNENIFRNTDLYLL